MSYALVFAGQGNQHPQMMPWLTVEQNPSAALLEMERVVGAAWRTTLENQALRSKGGFAQPLVVGTALAAWAVLKPLLPRPRRWLRVIALESWRLLPVLA